VSESQGDEREIRNLVARYCHAIAEGDDGAWAETWAQDGEWRVLGQALRGRDAIVAHYRKLVTGVAWVVQHAHHGLVDVQGDLASGRWLVMEHVRRDDGSALLNVARYRDRYARGRDGAWRFALRDLRVTYMGPPDLSGPPFPRVD
jgi:uncharacterized protein (TIGR02246 family)